MQENDIFTWKMERIRKNVPKGGYVVGVAATKTSLQEWWKAQGKGSLTLPMPICYERNNLSTANTNSLDYFAVIIKFYQSTVVLSM